MPSNPSPSEPVTIVTPDLIYPLTIGDARALVCRLRAYAFGYDQEAVAAAAVIRKLIDWVDAHKDRA